MNLMFPQTAPAMDSTLAKPEPLATSLLYDSRQLMGQAVEVQIRHGALLYRLRVTASGKLILTK